MLRPSELSRTSPELYLVTSTAHESIGIDRRLVRTQLS
jgi:hypothetical protein